jgi:hypothetical protein
LPDVTSKIACDQLARRGKSLWPPEKLSRLLLSKQTPGNCLIALLMKKIVIASEATRSILYRILDRVVAVAPRDDGKLGSRERERTGYRAAYRGLRFATAFLVVPDQNDEVNRRQYQDNAR